MILGIACKYFFNVLETQRSILAGKATWRIFFTGNEEMYFEKQRTTVELLPQKNIYAADTTYRNHSQHTFIILQYSYNAM